MGKRWFVYLMALLGCLVFYLAYQQWVSWLLLMGVLFLPIVSLLFSIPAIALAKVTRDDLMLTMAEEYPQYGFEIHKGYGTKAHYAALREHGASPVHRMTFLKKWEAKRP